MPVDSADKQLIEKILAACEGVEVARHNCDICPLARLSAQLQPDGYEDESITVTLAEFAELSPMWTRGFFAGFDARDIDAHGAKSAEALCVRGYEAGKFVYAQLIARGQVVGE